MKSLLTTTLGSCLVLLAAQITLGAFTILTAKHYIINSLHVVTGASVLATSLVLTLRTSRARLTTALRAASPSTASHPDMAHGGAKAGARA